MHGIANDLEALILDRSVDFKTMAEAISDGHPSLNAHGDVLNATPTDDAEKERLVTELKSRAGAAFKVFHSDDNATPQ